MIDLKNKKVSVIGGLSGIGRMCKRFLSRAGSDAAFTYNTNEKLANKLCNKGGSVL